MVEVEYLKNTYLDASAAVKLVIDEPGSEHILKYFDSNFIHFYRTSLCFAEALGVLRRKMEKKQISRDKYFNACFDLMSHLDHENIQLDDTLKISLVNVQSVEVKVDAALIAQLRTGYGELALEKAKHALCVSSDTPGTTPPASSPTTLDPSSTVSKML